MDIRNSRILVSGANGLIGQETVKKLLRENAHVVACTRSNQRPSSLKSQINLKYLKFDEINENTNWSAALKNVDYVVHCLGLTSYKSYSSKHAKKKFNYVNNELTVNLAKHASEQGVKRFIYLSTIKVNGEITFLGEPFRPESTPAPISAYSESKWNAECALIEVAQKSDMEVVIIRPPIVYSANNKGNLALLLSFIRSGVPLPSITNKNRRSIVSIDNLTDFIITCLRHKAVSNKVLFVSDGKDASTNELIGLMAKSCGKDPNFIPHSGIILQLLLKIFMQRNLIQKLFGSLQIDIKNTQRLTGWSPPYTTEECFKKYYSGGRFDA